MLTLMVLHTMLEPLLHEDAHLAFGVQGKPLTADKQVNEIVAMRTRDTGLSSRLVVPRVK